MPGDCAGAVSFGLGATSGPGDNGNGDGTVNTGGNSGAENYNFWLHLSAAGMVTGNYTGYTAQASPTLGVDLPLTKLSGAAIAISQPGAIFFDSTYPRRGWNNIFWIVRFSAYTPVGILTPYENYAIDQKLDDGLPNTGTMRVAHSVNDFGPFMEITGPGVGGGVSNPFGASGTDVCALSDTTPLIYNVGNTSGVDTTLCALEIKAGF